MEKSELEKLHTKQLLDRLSQLRRIPWYDCGCKDCCYTESYVHATPIKNLIKEILKTRPHIRNKKEAYEYRKAKAQGKL